MATTSEQPAAAAAWPPAGIRIDAHGECAVEGGAGTAPVLLTPLTQLGAIRAEGADAETFLQNQLSSDLRELGAARAQLSSYNSPKGRVLALFTLYRHGGAILLETRREGLEGTLKRLRMFVLRSKLKLDDASAALPALGLAGSGAAALLAAAGLPAPESDWACAADGELLVLRRPGPTPRFSLHAPAARIAALWQALAPRAQPAGSAAWRLLDIRAGLPSIHPQTADQFVPQMLNLDRLGAISFGKGCYPGQEIVARLHYLGNLKRRMFAAAAPEAVPPGTPVHAAGAGAEAVGQVVDCAPAEAGQALQVVLPLGLEHAADLRLGAADGPRLQVDWAEA